MKFQVGKKFPIPTYRNKPEGCYIMTGEGTFDLLVLLDSPSSHEIKATRLGSLKVGYFGSPNPPSSIVLLVSSQYELDAPFNPMSVSSDVMESYLESDGNLLTIYMVDRLSYKLCAMRGLGLDARITSAIRSNLSSLMEDAQSKAAIEFGTQMAQRMNIAQLMKAASATQVFKKLI